LTFRSQVPSFWTNARLYLNALVHLGPVALHLTWTRFRSHWVLRSRSRSPYAGNNKIFAWSTTHLDFELLQRTRVQVQVNIPTIISHAFATACGRILPLARLRENENLTVGQIITFFPYSDKKPVNRFTSFSYSISIKGDALEALKESHRAQVTAALQGSEALLLYYAFKVLGRMPVPLYPVCFSGSLDSFYLSNVPCSKGSFSFCGAECQDLAAFPPLPNQTGKRLAMQK
jgi:hypothetical protein